MANKDYKAFIVEGEAREPQIIHVTPGNIYDLEVLETEKFRVFVLSAFPEFLLDYFGVKLWKKSVRHIKYMGEFLCKD